MRRDGVHRNKEIKVLNTEEDRQWNYPDKIVGVKIIRRIAHRINDSEGQIKRIRTKTTKQHESDSKTDVVVVDRLARGWRMWNSQNSMKAEVSGSMAGTASFLINPGMSSTGGRGRWEKCRVSSNDDTWGTMGAWVDHESAQTSPEGVNEERTRISLRSRASQSTPLNQGWFSTSCDPPMRLPNRLVRSGWRKALISSLDNLSISLGQ